VHLVGFVITICHDARSHEREISLSMLKVSQFRPRMCVREVYGFCPGKVFIECKIGVAVIRKLCFAFPLIEVTGEILESGSTKPGT
jgi:hypothetical protein